MYFVRTAGERDLEKVRILLDETWHATYDRLYGAAKVDEIVRDWQSLPALKARLARKDGEFLVADDGKRIGGMAFAAMAKDVAKTTILHQIYVHPDCQREGVGRDLLAEIETCFPDADIMRLEVDPDNAAAIAFYRGVGFNEAGRIENSGPGQSGIPALVFEKPLPH